MREMIPGYEVILISKMIAKLDVDKITRQKITACTLYGQQAIERPNLYKRFAKCKTKKGGNKWQEKTKRSLGISTE